MSNVKVLTEIATERQLATNIRNSSYSLTTLLEGRIMEHVVTTVKIRGNINREDTVKITLTAFVMQ